MRQKRRGAYVDGHQVTLERARQPGSALQRGLAHDREPSTPHTIVGFRGIACVAWWGTTTTGHGDSATEPAASRADDDEVGLLVERAQEQCTWIAELDDPVGRPVVGHQDIDELLAAAQRVTPLVPRGEGLRMDA